MIELMKSPHEREKLLGILHPIVRQWFFSKFKDFSLPQLYGVMEIHSRNNILISAPTGGTKTLTAFLSILNELISASEKGILQDRVYCIYSSPLKALSRDIQKNLEEPLKEMEELAGKKFGIRIGLRTGDTTMAERQQMLRKPPHLLITTPESIALMLSSIKFRDHLTNIEWCIIDEIHSICDNKRGVHLSLSMERLKHISGHITRVGLSATISPLEDVAKFLVGEGRPCKIVDVQFIKEYDLKVLSPMQDLIGGEYALMHNSMYELIHKLIQEHKTTLIFTNTRSATERVVHNLKEKYPKSYGESNLGAHHGSLSKEHRQQLEDNLKNGMMKAVVCSTSLELGIDIGYIDLVICLGSPKSVARFLQRSGRAGHQLHEKVKARIIVMDRDDLVECAVLLKCAIEKKIDKIGIPFNCLDVLAQQLIGMALDQVWEEKEMYILVRKSYCFSTLSKEDFNETLSYLAGEYISLEDRHVYAKIWRKDGKVGRKGKMGRVIYMTNIGTIPDESFIKVKVGEQVVGHIDEAFLEKLRKGDIFVLGGSTYMFQFSRGMVAQVTASTNRPPTVPSWFSDMLPLSFDLAIEIGKFRRLLEEKFVNKRSKEEIIEFLKEYLYVDNDPANIIYEYAKEQYYFTKEIPSDKKILIEHFTDEDGSKKVIFHTMFGRRVNDCLSRAVAYAIGKTQHRDVEIGISDNGFYVGIMKKVDVMKSFRLLKSNELKKVLEFAIEQSEVLKRRFRHCATRALMILRNYKGKHKRVGRQQVSSMILMNALKRISNDFSILKESRREVLEDLMDIESSALVIKGVEEGKIKVKEINTQLPSPFGLNLVMQGKADLMKMEAKADFLKRMHKMLLAKIGMKHG